MNENQLFSELNLKEIEATTNKNITCCKRCLCFLRWFYTLGLWTFTILVILFQETIFIIVACIFYFHYLIAELFSPTLKSLCNISNQTINEIIEKFIKGKPNFYLKCECYHYEERPNGRDSTRTVEVITHSESMKYNYSSYRDISGLLILNTDESNIKGKYYIELEINKKVYLPDVNSISHYNSLTRNIIENNIHRDTYFRLLNIIDIEGLPNSFLIKMKENEEPWFIGSGFWFIIFTLLSFAELYKIYVNFLIFHQTFTIKKVISISYDVNMDQRFNSFNPSFFIRHTGQHFKYNVLNLSSMNLHNEHINEINNNNANAINGAHNENRNNQQNNINQEQNDTNESLSTNADERNNL